MSKYSIIAGAALLVVACGGQSSGDGNGGSAGAGGGAGGAVGGSAGTAGTGAGSGASTSGGSGGSAGAGGSAGTPAGGAPGGGGAPCASLQAAYIETITKAKSCNPNIDFEQCTTKVATELECPCGNTFVNGDNKEAMKNLSDLSYFWNQQKCGVGVACPEIACAEPSAGSCQGDSSGVTGSCKDSY